MKKSHSGKSTGILVIVLLAAILSVLASCGGGGAGSTSSHYSSSLYSQVGSWTVYNAGTYDYSGGMALAANSSYVVFAGISTGLDPDPVYRYAHNGTGGTNMTNWFNEVPDQPTAITLIGSNFYIADKNNYRFVRNTVGSDTGGEDEIRSRSSDPLLAYAIASNATSHYLLWFGSTTNHKVEHVSLDGTTGYDVRNFPVSDDPGNAMALDSSGNVYIACSWDNVVRKFDSEINDSITFGGSILSSPHDIAVNSHDEILVIDGYSCISVFDTSGNYQGSFGSFTSALGLAVYGDDLWVADYNGGSETIYHLTRN